MSRLAGSAASRGLSLRARIFRRSSDKAKHRDMYRHRGLSVQPKIDELPYHRVFGPGRDRRFRIPQYHVHLRGVDTVFADGGAGETIVFIHGLAGNVTHWVNVAPHFLDTHRVIAIDLPGHGESGVPDTWSIDNYVSHVIALLDCLGIDKVTLVGHSMGGMVSAAMTIQYPQRVHRTVLVNPAGMQPMPTPIRIAGHLLLRETLLRPVLPRIWKFGILDNVFFTKNAYTDAFIRTAEQTYDPKRDIQGIARVMDGLKRDLLDTNFAALLPKVTKPIFLIWGDRDRLVPAGFLRKAARRLPNVVVEEVARCGHMPIIECPDRVVAFVKRALS